MKAVHRPATRQSDQPTGASGATRGRASAVDQTTVWGVALSVLAQTWRPTALLDRLDYRLLHVEAPGMCLKVHSRRRPRSLHRDSVQQDV